MFFKAHLRGSVLVFQLVSPLWVSWVSGSTSRKYVWNCTFLIVGILEAYWNPATLSRVYGNGRVCRKFQGHDCLLQASHICTWLGIKDRKNVPSLRRETGFRVVHKKFSANAILLQKCWVLKELEHEVHKLLELSKYWIPFCVLHRCVSLRKEFQK